MQLLLFIFYKKVLKNNHLNSMKICFLNFITFFICNNFHLSVPSSTVKICKLDQFWLQRRLLQEWFMIKAWTCRMRMAQSKQKSWSVHSKANARLLRKNRSVQMQRPVCPAPARRYCANQRSKVRKERAHRFGIGRRKIEWPSRGCSRLGQHAAQNWLSKN